MKIKIIKILKYDLKTTSRGKIYDYLCSITSQEINPTTLEKNAMKLKEPVILSSSLNRAVDCIQRKDTLILNLLNEIPFELSQLCTQEEWFNQGSLIVRKRFKEAFINDTLLIKRHLIFEQIEDLINICKKLDSEIAVVSHSFRIKLIEAYIKTKGKIKDEPDLIEGFIFDNQKTLDFGCSIILEL